MGYTIKLFMERSVRYSLNFRNLAVKKIVFEATEVSKLNHDKILSKALYKLND